MERVFNMNWDEDVRWEDLMEVKTNLIFTNESLAQCIKEECGFVHEKCYCDFNITDNENSIINIKFRNDNYSLYLNNDKINSSIQISISKNNNDLDQIIWLQYYENVIKLTYNPNVLLNNKLIEAKIEQDIIKKSYTKELHNYSNFYYLHGALSNYILEIMFNSK